MARRTVVTEDDLAWLRNMRARGRLSYAALAERARIERGLALDRARVSRLLGEDPRWRLSDDDVLWMRRLRQSEGLTNRQIVERLRMERGITISPQRVAQLLGPSARNGHRGERISRNLSLTPEAEAALRDLAIKHGFINRSGTRAGEGSIAALVEAIGTGQLQVRRGE